MVKTYNIDATTILAGATAYSQVFNIIDKDGYFSLQLAITGDGTLSVSYEISNDGITYRTPQGVSSLLTGLTKTSGGSSDGKIIYQFNPHFGKFLKIKLIETGNSNTVAIIGTLAII